MRPCALLLAVVLALVPATPATAGPVAVRFAESITHGFLVVKAGDGSTIAHGEFIQYPQGERIHNQLTFRFTDGSLYDETVSFTQRRVFRLMSYKLVQKGPSFPETSEVSFDRESGRYRARSGKDTSDGKLDIPDDAYNGMSGVLLKNLPPGASATGHLLAFVPKPHVVRMTMAREGEDKYDVGDAAHTATRWLVKLEIEGLKGVLASLVGKDPPDLRYWIATGPVPGFVKFEGAMFLKGPRWRVELSAPRWPDAASRSAPRGSAPKS
jgi:hypothetical protein